MLLDGSGFTFLSFCFALLPLYQHVVFPAPSPSVWLEEAEPLVLALPGRAGCLPFLWDDCEDTRGIQRLMGGHEEKNGLAQGIKWTWLWLPTFVLVIFPGYMQWAISRITAICPITLSPPRHFPTDLLLWA